MLLIRNQVYQLSRSSFRLGPLFKSLKTAPVATGLQRSFSFTPNYRSGEPPASSNGKEPAKPQAKELLKSLKGTAVKENIYTIPNLLTFSRLITAPVIGYLVVKQHTSYAFGLFVYSCLSDLLDGWIARRFNMKSVVGSVIDPMADKALMMILASCLAISGDIPVYMACLILGRDAMLGVMALYYRYISLPPPKTFLRFWDFSLPSAEVRPTQISKINTFLQMVYLGSSLTYPALSGSFSPETAEILLTALKGLEYTVATTTVWSGASYLVSKDAVKILHKK
ncbi:cardiolipin synthase (CMP-forming) [Trichomonascus vanleenenianus]|uniref:cardiolipin synthase n=1 Tax=Trichomonascus vanleenenianus TaxID=2268995 RepID=UPI003EC9DB0A